MDFIVRKLDGSRRFTICAGSFSHMQAKVELELRQLVEAGEPVKKVSCYRWDDKADGNWIVERENGEQLWRGNIVAKMYTPRPQEAPKITNPDAPATDKQVAYLLRLGDKVGPNVRAHWIRTDRRMTKGEASRAIAALEDVAQW